MLMQQRILSQGQMQWRNAWRSKSLPQLIEPHETDTLQRKATVGNFFAKDRAEGSEEQLYVENQHEH